MTGACIQLIDIQWLILFSAEHPTEKVFFASLFEPIILFSELNILSYLIVFVQWKVKDDNIKTVKLTGQHVQEAPVIRMILEILLT